MRSLFVFAAVALSASAVLSSPVPAKTGDPIDDAIDTYLDEWQKHIPDVKFKPLSSVDFPALPNPFFTGEKDGFGDLQPRFPSWPKGFPHNFFKDLEKSLPKDAKNDTVENVREVDGHIIHEKESTYSNGDKDHQVVFKSKTVIIRPKNAQTDQVGTNVGAEVETVVGNKPNTVETQPKSRNVQSRSPKPKTSNPDDEVEMFYVSKNQDQDDDRSI